MADAPTRPVFNERQVISSADLNLVVSHDVDADARTRRALSTPGVAGGLRLHSVDVPRTLASGTSIITKKITVTRGSFIDENGRLVVVPDDVLLRETDVEGTLTEDPARSGLTFPLPVLIRAVEEPMQATRSVAGPCATSGGPTRIAERSKIRIGRPGDELARQRPGLAPSAGANGDGRESEVLLGFVRVDITSKQFVEVFAESGQVRRGEAGLRADGIAGRAGRISLQTSDQVIAGTAVTLLDASSNKVLTVGISDGKGALSELFSVDAKGDAFVKGALHATRSEEGRVAVQSGLINHGLRVPLPPGVTEDEVRSGVKVLHIQLSAWSPPDRSTPVPPLTTSLFSLDELRRVSCHVIDLTTLGAATPSVVRGTCAYVVVAVVPPAGANT